MLIRVKFLSLLIIRNNFKLWTNHAINCLEKYTLNDKTDQVLTQFDFVKEYPYSMLCRRMVAAQDVTLYLCSHQLPSSRQIFIYLLT